MISNNKLKTLDRLGAGMSFACAVHCALYPLLLAALPMLGLSGLLNETLESWFLAFSVLLASTTLALGWHQHRQSSLLFPLLFGVFLIGLSRWEPLESYEIYLAVSGALSITLSHLLNMQVTRQQNCDCDAHEEIQPMHLSENPFESPQLELTL